MELEHFVYLMFCGVVVIVCCKNMKKQFLGKGKIF